MEKKTKSPALSALVWAAIILCALALLLWADHPAAKTPGDGAVYVWKEAARG